MNLRISLIIGNISDVLLNHNDYQAVQCKKIK